MRLVLGIVLGAALAVGTALVVARVGDGCVGRCGEGTRCRDHRCVALPSTAPAVPAKETRKRRRTGGAAAEIQLHPGDEKMVAQGDALGRPEHIDLSQPDERELQQEDLDRVFQPAQGAISRCITDALGDAPLESGRVEVAFRVERGGAVRKVRVVAPALLQQKGVARCVRGVVTALSFPASGGASVVTYPFELH